MPANQSPSAGSSDQDRAWQLQLDRDRLMGRRYVEAGKLGGPGAAAMPAAGAAMSSKPSTGGGLAMPSSLPQMGGGRGNQAQPDSNAAAMESYKDTAKIGQAAAQGAAKGGVIGAVGGAAVEVGKQAMTNPSAAVKSTLINPLLMAMWSQPLALVIVNGYLFASVFNMPGSNKLSAAEKMLIIVCDLVYSFIMLIVIVLIVTIACPFLPECPVPKTDFLGLVIDFAL
jgi:hypothetical protein